MNQVYNILSFAINIFAHFCLIVLRASGLKATKPEALGRVTKTVTT